MNIDLTGKQAIVCGASKGIGRAAAHELALLGASVTLVARDADALAVVRDSLPCAAGQIHHALAADLSILAALPGLMAAHLQKTGDVHILVNNSGGPPAGPAHLAAPGDFLTAFTQHLLASHVMMQSVLPGMRRLGYGRIINVISTSVKQPLKGLGVSNTVRGAVANWAKTLAGELAGDGITVNNVLPGATQTGRLEEILGGRAQKTGRRVEDIIAEEKTHIPAGRFAAPAELAQAIAFLASPAASYINGINLPVDGGRTGSL